MSEVGGAHSHGQHYDEMVSQLSKVDSAMSHKPGKSGTMKAVRFHGKKDVRYEDIPNPTCGKGQIKVKPAWCGICGTGRIIKRLLYASVATADRNPRLA